MTAPSLDAWLKEAKAHPSAPKVGMYLIHNGTVRESAKSQVREGKASPAVSGMVFSYDPEKLRQIIDDAKALEGIFYLRVWLNQGQLQVGDDLMLVLIGGDIRPRVVDALQYLVGRIKEECVCEQELFRQATESLPEA